MSEPHTCDFNTLCCIIIYTGPIRNFQPVLKRAVRLAGNVRVCTYNILRMGWTRTCAARQSTYLHVAHTYTQRWLPSFCRIYSKSLPPVLCRCPVSACEHSHTSSYTHGVDCLSAVSAQKYRMFATCLVPMSCI